MATEPSKHLQERPLTSAEEALARDMRESMERALGTLLATESAMDRLGVIA